MFVQRAKLQQAAKILHNKGRAVGCGGGVLCSLIAAEFGAMAMECGARSAQ